MVGIIIKVSDVIIFYGNVLELNCNWQPRYSIFRKMTERWDYRIRYIPPRRLTFINDDDEGSEKANATFKKRH